MRHETSWTRRDFLRGTAGGGLAAALGFGAEGPRKEAKEPARTRVVIVRRRDALDASHKPRAEVVASMLAEGLKALSGAARSAEDAWRAYFRRDDAVTVKANVMITPTHTEVTRAIMEGVRAVGIPRDRIRVWDRNRGGIGPEQADRGTWSWTPGFGPDAVSRAVTGATALVNVPGLKTHWLSGIGCALKNWAGAVTRINVRDRDVAFAFHTDSCANIGVLNAIPAIRKRCRLIVVDALRPLCHSGPQIDPRYLWDYGGLLLGTDPVAVDTVALRIIQARRDEIRGARWPVSPPPKHIAVAAERYDLGICDPERIEIVEIGDAKGRAASA